MDKIIKFECPAVFRICGDYGEMCYRDENNIDHVFYLDRVINKKARQNIIKDLKNE